ncbi:MAG: L,D-transpeptidase family protein [Pseudomonadota bacterium]|nr:L,D-transpeptidase family protein [Pseudomonadota bacterium]
MKLLKCIACGLILGTALAGPALAVEPGAPEQLILRLDAVKLEVQKRLNGKLKTPTERDKDEIGALVEFYSEQDNAPVWVDEKGLNDKARAIMKEFAKAGEYGMTPSDYPVPEQSAPDASKPYPAEWLAEAELMLSRSAIAYTNHARGGRIDPSSIGGSLDPTLRLPDPHDVMVKVAAASDPAEVIRGYQPKHPQFDLLRKRLAEINGGEAKKQVVVPDGPMLKPGVKHASVEKLRERLGLEAPKDGKADLYDDAVAEAVKEFQASRGLKPDGVFGSSTRNAINARPKDRAKTILANMERWRWIPDDTEGMQVRVNVPEFMFRVLKDGKVIHTERVVVGKAETKTPIFSDEMERIEFNPYWNVPDSIKVEEILPNLRRRSETGGGFFSSFVTGNPRWVARNNIEIKYNGRQVDPTQIDWDKVDIRKFHFYQPPGGPNVLGVVKFMFPNKHDVYMHDTSSRSLFNQTVRTYSHGCMRVRDPLKFAELLLSGEENWSMGRIQGVVKSGNHFPVQLTKTVPVHISYFTAEVTADGTVKYLNDIYGHDARIAAALNSKD